MNSTASLLVRAALAATLLLGASGTYAADQLVSGKKLLIKNPPAGTTANKVVHLAKDATVTIGAAGSAGDPQCTGTGGGGTSSLSVVASGGAGDVTILLPCGGWTTNGANTLYKYKDPTGATCNLVLVKNGVLVKAVCKGSQVAIDLNGSMSPVAVVTTLNSQKYCTEFEGSVVHDGSDDKTFLRKDATAPGSCPGTSVPATTTTSTLETTTTSTPTLLPCGSGGICSAESCPGGVLCSFDDTTGACACPTSTQCEAGTCFGDSNSCDGCPSCPAGYTCGATFSSACASGIIFGCLGPACGSDCSCPAGGHCTVSTPTTSTTSTSTTSTSTTSTTTSTLLPCGSGGICSGGSCPGGVFCSFSQTVSDCGCPTSTQCDAGTCFGDSISCFGCPSCPAGYTCGAAPSSACGPGQVFIFGCLGPACGSDCSCPAGGHCVVP